MRRAGLLNEIIKIYKVNWVKDSYGSQVETLELRLETRANTTTNGRGRNIEHSEVVHDYSATFLVRYYVELNDFDIIEWQGKFYRILNFIKERDRNQITVYTEWLRDYNPTIVEVVKSDTVYVGSAKNLTSDPWPIESFTPAVTSTETIIDYTPTELVNVIIAVCPSTMSLSSCIKHGEIEDDITSRMLASETEVTYEGVTCKMYQFKYGSTIRNNAFTFEFN